MDPWHQTRYRSEVVQSPDIELTNI